MGEYFLGPKEEDGFLTPDEALIRLTHEFRYVTASRQDANPTKAERKQHLRVLKETGVPPAVIEKWKETHADGVAISLTVCDAIPPGNSYLILLIRPETGLTIGFESEEHEKASRKLVTRVAKALGYAKMKD